jgi:enamine deaminase RidA (YjgF/YER057c/UK114 family)
LPLAATCGKSVETSNLNPESTHSMSTPEARLDALGIALPAPMKPVATYVPYVITGNLLFVSGQVSATPNGRMQRTVGEDMELSAAQQAARQCGINLIAQCKAAVGDLSRIKRVVKLGGFVNAAPALHRHPAGHQWLLRPHGRSLRRCRPPRALRRRLPRPSHWRRRRSRW